MIVTMASVFQDYAFAVQIFSTETWRAACCDSPLTNWLRLILWLTPSAMGLQRTVGMEQRLPRGRLSSFEFRYMTEFQSHEPEFDYLKSFEIEEKINKVRWVNQPSASRMILSTNDKTIKLWKVRTHGLSFKFLRMRMRTLA